MEEGELCPLETEKGEDMRHDMDKLIKACDAAADASHKMRCAKRGGPHPEVWGLEVAARYNDILEALQPMTLEEKKQLYFALKEELKL